MAIKHRYHEPQKVLYVAAADVDGGEVVEVGDVPLITSRKIAAGEMDNIASRGGVYQVTADGAMSAGDRVYWNSSAKKVSRTKTGNLPFGYVAKGWSASVDGDEVYVVHEPSMTAGEDRIDVYANASARDAALPSPADGMVCYVESVWAKMVYSATDSEWVKSGGGIDELANADAPNDYTYYSSDNDCLMWKDSSGNLIPIA